jgi:hypothetical protein
VKKLLSLFAGLALGCSGPDAAAPLAPETGGSSSGGSAGAAGAPVDMPNPLGRYRCKAPAGTSGSPQTIEEAVALLNALPKPTSVACFVEALDRPLNVFSTNSPFSAQPALSNKSPRVFIKTGPLWTSIVIAGDPSYLIEFGYLIPGTLRSIKGELHLPLDAPVVPSAPYDRVHSASATTSCGLCHFDERLETVPGVANAFSSVAFKPRPDSHVPLQGLALEAQTCSWQAEPQRCELLAAMFGGGQVVEAPFPDSMLTFF